MLDNELCTLLLKKTKTIKIVKLLNSKKVKEAARILFIPPSLKLCKCYFTY